MPPGSLSAGTYAGVHQAAGPVARHGPHRWHGAETHTAVQDLNPPPHARTSGSRPVAEHSGLCTESDMSDASLACRIWILGDGCYQVRLCHGFTVGFSWMNRFLWISHLLRFVYSLVYKDIHCAEDVTLTRLEWSRSTFLPQAGKCEIIPQSSPKLQAGLEGWARHRGPLHMQGPSALKLVAWINRVILWRTT